MSVERLLGGSPLSVIFRLIVLSIVVGIVLSALGLSPAELFRRLDFLLQRFFDLGFRWIETLFGYFLIGAVIVVPIWLIARLMGGGKGKDDTRA